MKFVQEKAGISTSVGGAIAIVVIVVIGLLIYAFSRPATTPQSGTTTGTCTLDCSSSSALVTSSNMTSSPSSSSASASTSVSTSSSNSSMSVAGAIVTMPKGAGAGQSGAPGFAPDNVTVIIGVNSTITWTNNDTVSHTVFSSSVPPGATAFMSPIIPADGTYSHTFTVPGVYEYYCSLHNWMKGTIIVEASPTPK